MRNGEWPGKKSTSQQLTSYFKANSRGKSTKAINRFDLKWNFFYEILLNHISWCRKVFFSIYEPYSTIGANDWRKKIWKKLWKLMLTITEITINYLSPFASIFLKYLYAFILFFLRCLYILHTLFAFIFVGIFTIFYCISSNTGTWCAL